MGLSRMLKIPSILLGCGEIHGDNINMKLFEV